MKVLNPNNLPTAPISELQATQGDLKFLSKQNYAKLKNTIEKHGFDVPVTVWIDSQGDKWLLDGHQRKHVLETEGWNEPIPYLIIKAPNMQEAAERLLQITSQYGTITQEGLDEYIAKFELPEMEIKELTNFDGIFEFPMAMPEPEEEDHTLEVEPEVEVFSEEGVTYALGPHRVKCGTEKGELSPEKVDAYRKKYHRIVTGVEDGWQSGTPDASEGL
jgi:hypothetical protein